MILQNNTHRGEECEGIRKMCVENRCWAIRIEDWILKRQFLCLSWFEFELFFSFLHFTVLTSNSSSEVNSPNVRWDNLFFDTFEHAHAASLEQSSIGTQFKKNKNLSQRHSTSVVSAKNTSHFSPATSNNKQQSISESSIFSAHTFEDIKRDLRW